MEGRLLWAERPGSTPRVLHQNLHDKIREMLAQALQIFSKMTVEKNSLKWQTDGDKVSTI
jgi:hypothetical protein